jgi:Xaa-Pro aminopeptidase
MQKNESPSIETGGKHHASYVPRLSQEERDRRWQMLREMMVQEGLDCLIVVGNDLKVGMAMANMRWITSIGSSHGGYVFFPLVGDPVVWNNPTHCNLPKSSYAYTQDWVTDIRPETGPGPVVKYLQEHKYDRATIGLAGYGNQLLFGDTIPVGISDYLHKELPDARFVSATGKLNYFHTIKSPEEIGMLEKAGEIARKMIDTLIRSAEPGKKECELYADMIHTQIANGGEAQIFLLMRSGPVAGPPGKLLLHGGDPPAVPTIRPLALGDLIILEFHAPYAGYLSAVEYALFLGKAPDEMKRIHDVCIQCFTNLVGAMKPGASFHEVLQAEREPCLRAGMDYIELGFHQHGLASGGALSAVYKPGEGPMGGDLLSGLIIRENMVFGTNIDIHNPKWKADVGIQFGDTLHVTKDGARCLVNTPQNIFEKTF